MVVGARQSVCVWEKKKEKREVVQGGPQRTGTMLVSSFFERLSFLFIFSGSLRGNGAATGFSLFFLLFLFSALLSPFLCFSPCFPSLRSLLLFCSQTLRGDGRARSPLVVDKSGRGGG
jgi:hypothetical protein